MSEKIFIFAEVTFKHKVTKTRRNYGFIRNYELSDFVSLCSVYLESDPEILDTKK